MKKTLIINIGNSIIHIAEDAYEILTAYLNEIKHHFAKNADDFEIITDIENRVAEMFAEILLASNKQVIDIDDVQNIITQMGRVQDFLGDEEQANTTNQFDNYFGPKKLYRDTEEAAIAGVCAGLGHYLNTEARWIRLVAFLSIFLGGAGVLAYIILWVVMPRAISRSEKMEMKGEATNLYGYQKSFEEELAAFKENMKSANAHFKPFVKNTSNFITEAGQIIGKLLNGTAKVIFKIIAGFIIGFGFIFLISLLISLAAFLGFWDANAYDYFPLSIINVGFRNTLIFAAFLVLFIPILALVLFAIRAAFNKMAINRTFSFALLIIWLLGVGTTVYYVAKISAEFQEHAELVQVTDLKSYPTYVLTIDNNMVLSKADSLDYRITENDFKGRLIVDDSQDHPFSIPRNVCIEIEKSSNNKITLLQNYQSQGKTFKFALQQAQNINYKYTQQDSLLTFSPNLQLKNKTTWRNQEVHLTLKIPVGTHVMINYNLYNYLQFYYYSCNTNDNQDNEYREWVMTEDGLKCKAELDKPNTDNPE